MKQQDFIRDPDGKGDDSIVIGTAKRRKLDLIARLICLLFAFVLWIYFVNINDDGVTAEIKVTLEVVGKDTLKNETGQMVYGLDTQEVTIVVKGTNRDIKKYSSADYKVTVDVSKISGSGKHIMEVTPILPGDSSVKLSVESVFPQNVIIYSDEVNTREVPLEVLNVGIDTPYTIGNITKSTDKVAITGPRAIVESIEKAQFRISETTPFHTSTTYSGFKLDFCDANGEYVPYDDSIITYSTSEIKVEVPIYTQKDVGISVLSSGAPIDTSKYTVTVDPLSISIIGDPTRLLADTMKDYKIPIVLTPEEIESGTAVRIITDSDLPTGIRLNKRDEGVIDGAASVAITVTITKNN